MKKQTRTQIKRTIAAMYATVTIPVLIMTTSLTEHFEHAMCYSKAANNINTRD